MTKSCFIDNSNFYNFQSSAIRLAGVSKCELVHDIFGYCYSSDKGGALYVEGVTLLSFCCFGHCTSNSEGNSALIIGPCKVSFTTISFCGWPDNQGVDDAFATEEGNTSIVNTNSSHNIVNGQYAATGFQIFDSQLGVIKFVQASNSTGSDCLEIGNFTYIKIYNSLFSHCASSISPFLFSSLNNADIENAIIKNCGSKLYEIHAIDTTVTLVNCTFIGQYTADPINGLTVTSSLELPLIPAGFQTGECQGYAQLEESSLWNGKRFHCVVLSLFPPTVKT